MGKAADLRALGRAVRATRKRIGILQRDLARQLGVPPAWLTTLEMELITGTGRLQHPERLEVVRRWLREQASRHDGATGG